MKNNVIYVDFYQKNNGKKGNLFRRIINRIKLLFHFSKNYSTPKNVIIYRKNIS
ncbi:hypothetical protein BD780_003939 [Clostridium tetanomorphum]|uniref:Uncharacterized protein n=1 Tax=Clostridium tetanomorphum TaxID=1553 RepID=A0A923J1K8_CLOTT|nr:hypothetical protein [Clostridium tetanomorphum]MBC2399282.1 hypothetical protein [Clostridium tetanomorphum]MBP1866086.1 hypothetical protein [Clostridium tetanomorphum]NRS86714.1 hypothetical protein [Clostridium tetanomorphum]NRZ99533.1 hypothetical protein [Clostridium tetanomorphum]